MTVSAATVPRERGGMTVATTVGTEMAEVCGAQAWLVGVAAGVLDAAAGPVGTAAGMAVGTAIAGTAGLGAGAVARWLLARLRRGTRVRAPACELANGGLWAVTGCLWGAGRLPSAWLPVMLGLGWLGVAACVVDIRHRRLPNALTGLAACFAPLGLLPLGSGAFGRGLLGGLAAVISYGVVHLLRPNALGAGDVKLAAPLGAVLGAASWAALAAAAVLAAVLTGIVGLVVACARRVPPGAGVPHGPSMLGAAWLVTLVAAGSGG